MKKEYLVERVSRAETDAPRFWEGIEPAKIDVYRWPEHQTYRPAAEAKMVWSEAGFHLLLSAFEKQLRSEKTKTNDGVCTDSCLEFFFQPSGERYINFEFNPRGVVLFHIGTDRWNNDALPERLVPVLSIVPSFPDEVPYSDEEILWQIRFDIPFTMLEEFYPGAEYHSGTVMRGNFYKCGDDTGHTHYGSWNPVLTGVPDFHQPDYFGELILL